jgi:nondiscriminating glutamyl-tRNA synthetase
MENKIRVRFAPSPTGHVHVGSLRTALYNYLFAKKNGGEFLLRIEDTDKNRFVEGSTEGLIRVLQWAGIDYSEGVYLEGGKIIQKGENGPYIQSDRLEIYKKYADQLVKDGKAYYCFCEPERLSKMREDQVAQKRAPKYDRYCLRSVSEEEINNKLKSNCSYTIRLKIPQDEIIEFDDLIRGKVSINSNTIDDQILLKSDGFPTYHLANVIDDHLMGITHVIRAEEWLPSTPKHILLYRALGWEIPQFAHLPLLLSTDKKKLSKRMGDVAVEDYINKGYLKEAIINFVALLGWNPGEGSTQEMFSMEELIDNFDLLHVHKGGAVFDLKKLDWLNAQYIKSVTTDQLYQLSASPSSSPSLSPSPSPSFWELHEFFNRAPEEKKSEEYLKKVLTIEQERLDNLSGVGEGNKFFFEDINYDKELLRWKNMKDADVKNNLEKAKDILENIIDNDWTRENLEKILLESAGEKRGEFLWPLRVALTGEQKSPSPSDVAWVLGKKECLSRLEVALRGLIN